MPGFVHAIEKDAPQSAGPTHLEGVSQNRGEKALADPDVHQDQCTHRIKFDATPATKITRRDFGRRSKCY